MKLSSVAVPAALALVASAADSEETTLFKPFDKSILSSLSFFEQFDSDDWAQLWKISKAKRDDSFEYVGEWAVEEPSIFPGFQNDKGLVLKTAAAHHAIHAKLPTPFVNTNKTLVLQYEVKLQEGLKCGGAYVKLLSSDGLPSEEDQFNNDTPYQIMFGPDKCGSTNKVHFIIQRKNKITGEYEEKHLSVPPISRSGKTTNLYTLIVKPNQDFEIRINGETAKAGNLLDLGVLKPGLNPPKEIVDVNDTKPEDWDDRDMIPDPDQAEKPEDWDEDAPYLIPDPNQTEKPESWDEDAEEYIPDPEAQKPEDWDDEEDGEWVAPLISNPECEVHGCGEWKAELVANPDYKGKWEQPLIKNPDYKGEWEPRTIPNPDYYEDTRPSDLESIGGIGFELWSMENNILFDNIYLGHSVEEAELIGNETFVPKVELEQQAIHESNENDEKIDAKEPEVGKVDDPSSSNDVFEELVSQLTGFVTDGQDYVKDFLADPVTVLSERPVEGGLYAVVLVAISTFFLSFISLILGSFVGSSASPRSSKREEEKVVEVKEESKASGASVTESTVRKVSEKSN